MEYLKLFLSTMVLVIFFDLIWLGAVAKNFYEENIGFLLRKVDHVLTPHWPAAVMVYIAITAGIICFVLPKANGQYLPALAWGAAFGAITYGIYDFTNLAILANWPLKVTLVDLAWGTALCGTVSVFAVFMQHYLNS